MIPCKGKINKYIIEVPHFTPTLGTIMQHFVISFFILKRQFDIFSDILYIPSCPNVRKKLILIQVHV